MNNKLYVGNLPFSLGEESLKELFAQAGNVQSVKIVTDSFDGRSKGYGFIEMSTEAEAENAMQTLNGTEVGGRSIRVDMARPKESRGNGSGGGGHRGGGRDFRGGGRGPGGPRGPRGDRGDSGDRHSR